MNRTAIAIDDEPLALDIIKFYCKKVPDLHLIQTFTNPIVALDYLKTTPPDLIFLDIEMPSLKGLDLASQVFERVKIIFTTAYHQYAVESYHVAAIDYLLKPFSFERFEKAIAKFYQFAKPAPPKHIQLRINGFLVKIMIDDLAYIEARKDYLKIHFKLSPDTELVRMTMKAMLDMLPKDQFTRIHRSYIVNNEAVIKQNVHEVFIKDLVLPKRM